MMAMSMYLAANLASAEQESKKFLNEEVDAELAPVLKVWIAPWGGLWNINQHL